MMISSSISHLCLLFCLAFFLLIILPFPSNASDPDPLQDICVADLNASISVNGFPCKPEMEVTSDDFSHDLSREANTSNAFGFAITDGSVLQVPGVNTQGLSMNRIDIAVGGLVPPHAHPRATESDVLITGKVLVGFITTSNVFYYKVLTPGMTFLFPRGLLHFLMNVGGENVVVFNSFNSQSPGLQLVSSSLFNTTPPIPEDVLTKAFLVGDDIIDEIKSAITQSQIGLSSPAWMNI